MRRQHRRKKNNKISGTLLPGNGSLIGAERTFDFYLGGSAIQTAEIDVLSHIRDQCNREAKCDSLQCRSSYLKAFKITVEASKKEKLLFASVWPRDVPNNKYFKPSVAQSHGRDN